MNMILRRERDRQQLLRLVQVVALQGRPDLRFEGTNGCHPMVLRFLEYSSVPLGLVGGDLAASDGTILGTRPSIRIGSGPFASALTYATATVCNTQYFEVPSCCTPVR